MADLHTTCSDCGSLIESVTVVADKPRGRSRFVTVTHHGRSATTIVKSQKDVDAAAERLLMPLRAQCNTLGPPWRPEPIDVTDDGPQCPSIARRREAQR